MIKEEEFKDQLDTQKMEFADEIKEIEQKIQEVKQFNNYEMTRENEYQVSQIKLALENCFLKI